MGNMHGIEDRGNDAKTGPSSQALVLDCSPANNGRKSEGLGLVLTSSLKALTAHGCTIGPGSFTEYSKRISDKIRSDQIRLDQQQLVGAASA